MTHRGAAEYLLERWVADEERIHLALQARSVPAQRAALGRAAVYFGVARSLRTSAEAVAGLPRFELLRRAIATVRAPDVSPARFEATTIAVARDVASRYGGGLYLSLASKLLWAKFRHPFVIYDSVVREHLGTPRGDYGAYLEAWRARYAKQERAIRSACDALASGRQRAADESTIPPATRSIASEEWFRRRVLDVFIWHRNV